MLQMTTGSCRGTLGITAWKKDYSDNTKINFQNHERTSMRADEMKESNWKVYTSMQ